MMNRIVIVALALASASPLAAGQGLAWQESNGVVYVTGGVGEEELEQISAARKDFNVRLLMAEKSGAYVSGVSVVIVDAKGGRKLEVDGAGPYLLARLPAGSYQVRATYEGQTAQLRFDVPAAGAREAVLRW